MKQLTLTLVTALVAINAWSYEAPTKAEKKPTRAEVIRTEGYACGVTEMDNFEKYRGRLPTNDEMDAILDACVNQIRK